MEEGETIVRPFWRKTPEAPVPVVETPESLERAKRRRWVRETWENYGLQLWMLDDDEPLFLWSLHIKELSLHHGGELPSRWACGYCGSQEQAGSKCSACNGPKRGRKQTADLALFGPLPHALVLNGVSPLFTLEVHYVECGRMDEYVPERIVARMHDCSILSQEVIGFADFDDASSNWGRSPHGLNMQYDISCQVSFIIKELFNLDYYRSA